MKNDLDFQIIVPFFNEEENFKQFIKLVETIQLYDEVFIIVDNGSDTDFLENYYKNQKKISGWTFVKSEKNLGFGGGVKFGSKYAVKEYIAWMPGNLKVDPREAFKLFLNQDLNGEKLHIKCRRMNRPLIDAIKTSLFGIVASFYFRTLLFDAGGTPNLINKKFFLDDSGYPNDFSFDLFVYYFFKKNDFTLSRPKINYTTRMYGKSHWQKGIISEIELMISILNYKKSWNKLLNNYEY